MWDLRHSYLFLKELCKQNFVSRLWQLFVFTYCTYVFHNEMSLVSYMLGHRGELEQLCPSHRQVALIGADANHSSPPRRGAREISSWAGPLVKWPVSASNDLSAARIDKIFIFHLNYPMYFDSQSNHFKVATAL